MIQSNGIYAGTFDEFRDFIIQKIYEDCQNERKSDFCGVDIGFCHTITSLDKYYQNKGYGFEECKEDVEGWYGVHLLEAGFEDSSNRQFCSNYYGGGDFGVCDIFLDDLDKEYVAREVEKMITSTFGYGHSKEICVWEEQK